jgi:hypothetical protein
MASTITPNVTDDSVVLANTTVTLGSVNRVTPIDWRTKWGGYIFARIGRLGTTALTNGVTVLIRRVIAPSGAYSAATAVLHPAAVSPFVGGITAAVSTTCAASGNPAGSASLTVASTTSFVVGGYIYIDGAGSGNKEFLRVAKITSGTVLLLDAPTQLAHNSASDNVTTQADVLTPVWVDGGSFIEVVIDYGASTTGSSVAAEVYAQSFDSYAAT